MLADCFAVAFTWVVVVSAYDFFVGILNYSPQHYLRLWPVITVFVGVNMVCRLYHGSWMYPAVPLSPVEEFRRLFASSVFTHVLLMAFLAFSRHNLEYSRFIIGASGLFIGIFSQTVRNLVRQILFKLKICQMPVALAGGGAVAKRVESVIEKSAYLGLKVALKFDDAHLRDVVPESRKLDVKILLACQDDRAFRVQLREFATWFNYVEYLPRTEVFPVFGAHAVSMDGLGGLEMKNQGRMKVLRWEKRLIDFILALFGFLLTLPLFILIPVLIKLTSKGPVFHLAPRLGRHGEPFKVFKFRSMYADAEERLQRLLESDPVIAEEYQRDFKIRNDPRVTPVGRLLRKTSLDELPQFFNVFRGEMALIGPRPIVEEEVGYYGADYEVLCRVRPGITGLWQCSGRSDTDYPRRVSLDVYYILNWSIWMDFWICIRTVYSIILMKGAC